MRGRKRNRFEERSRRRKSENVDVQFCANIALPLYMTPNIFRKLNMTLEKEMMQHLYTEPSILRKPKMTPKQRKRDECKRSVTPD